MENTKITNGNGTELETYSDHMADDFEPMPPTHNIALYTDIDVGDGETESFKISFGAWPIEGGKLKGSFTLGKRKFRFVVAQRQSREGKAV